MTPPMIKDVEAERFAPVERDLVLEIASLAENLKHVQDVSSAKIQREFSSLLEEWRTGRGTTSNMTKILMHPAYQRIIGLGPAVLPLIFQEMRRTPDHWHWALCSITGEEPVPEEHAGNLGAITEDWLNWGKSRGFGK